MRSEVEKFAEAMEEVLQKHDPDKGDSWVELPLPYLENKLVEEIGELRDAIGINVRKHEMLDVANIMMMLWNRYSFVDTDGI